MKNLLFGVFAIFTALNFAYAQNEKFNNVGEFHNQQMSIYFDALKKDALKFSDSKQIREIAFENFSKQIDIVYGNKNEKIKQFANEGLRKTISSDMNLIIDQMISEIKNSPYKNENVKDFCIEIVNEIRDLTTINSDKYFDEKLEIAQRQFDGQDLEIIANTIAIGKASIPYWEENLESIAKSLNISNFTYAAKGIRSIGAGDAAGFCTGALYGAVGGTAFLPGVGTVSGALAVGCAGGLYGSIGMAFKNLFD